jgi:ketosteroid isomerase-like protein
MTAFKPPESHRARHLQKPGLRRKAMAHQTNHTNPNGQSAKVTNIESARPKKRARRGKKKDPAIQSFLDEFTGALTAGNGHAVAEMWLTPAFFLSEDMLKATEDKADIAEFFAGAKKMYADKGITDTRAEIENIEWLTDKLVMVAVRFPYLDEQGEEHGDERSTYTLRKEDDGGYRFCVAVMKGASEPEKNDAEGEMKAAEDAN